MAVGSTVGPQTPGVAVKSEIGISVAYAGSGVGAHGVSVCTGVADGTSGVYDRSGVSLASTVAVTIRGLSVEVGSIVPVSVGVAVLVSVTVGVAVEVPFPAW